MKAFIRLHIIAEGQTEEKFVKHTLSEHLGSFQISTDVRRVFVSRDKRHAKMYRGGLLDYEKAKKDIRTWLKEEQGTACRFTSMFDLYALPENFPAYRETATLRDPYQRVERLERAFQDDIGDRRFIPYLQLHEFEALVLANPANLEYEYFEHADAIKQLQGILQEMGGNPELINDNPKTAPSKRIQALIPEYDKVNVGAEIAGINGIGFLKGTCPHFSAWLTRLETLSDGINRG